MDRQDYLDLLISEYGDHEFVSEWNEYCYINQFDHLYENWEAFYQYAEERFEEELQGPDFSLDFKDPHGDID